MKIEEINALILNRLHRLEKQENINILFALESGSRAWGMASRDSDFDVRFIYTYPRDQYGKLFPKVKQNIDMEKEVIKNQDGVIVPLDGVGWDITKYLQLLQKSNPSAIEWAVSNEYYITHKFNQEIKSVINRFNRFTLVKHYTSLGFSNYNRFIKGRQKVKGKKYLYVLRGILNAFHIYIYNSIPSMNFSKVVESLHNFEEITIPSELESVLPLDGELTELIDLMIKNKREALEMDNIDPLRGLNELIDKSFELLQSSEINSKLEQRISPGFDEEYLEVLFQKYTS